MSPLTIALLAALAYATVITGLALFFLDCNDENRKQAAAYRRLALDAQQTAEEAVSKAEWLDAEANHLSAETCRLRAELVKQRGIYSTDAGLVRKVEPSAEDVADVRLLRTTGDLDWLPEQREES